MNTIWKNVIKAYRYIVSTHRWSLMYKGVQDGRYVEIEQPKSLSRADSFIVEYKGRVYVFFEELLVGCNQKGYLSVGELDVASNSILNVQKILEKEYHLSYPFIFEYQHEWYMVPESGANLAIDLYKFTSFPDKLKKVKTLINNIDAVDTTIAIKDNMIYLFTNIRKNGGHHSGNLSLYYSDNLLNSDFIQHPESCLNNDDRYARMAGSVIKEGEKMFRMAQDCGISYGYCIHKFEILKLSKESYKEKLVETIYPFKGYGALHTFNKSENFEIIDVVKNSASINNILRNALKLARVAFKKTFYK